jgi:predicted nucleotide-binding protein (sugar kinase/HSP70/actin superfamily)
MGDSSYGLAAALRAYGQPAEVMPLADEAALIDGRSFTSGKECLPCAITTGDMLKVIKSEGFEPERAAFFMPTACGPCRFGMYNCLHRQVLRYIDCDDASVVAPNQDSSFYSEFTKIAGVKSTTQFSKDLWISVVGLDLLRKVVLKLRPFAVDSKGAERLYQDCIRRWEKAVERRGSLSQMRALLEVFAQDFSAIEFDHTVSRPRVGIVGEIYVRSHPFANDNVISRLEALGAVCDLAPLAEWIYYTNFTRARIARRRGQFKDLLTNLIQDYFQHKIEKYLARPLEERFGPLAEEPVESTLEMAGPYIHNTFEGEAILSIGKTVEYYHQGVGGVVNVMPFTCMPSTIVSTQTRRISADCDDMPILNLSFDGQEDSTLTTRLEAFVEQVRQRRSCNVSVAELTAV